MEFSYFICAFMVDPFLGFTFPAVALQGTMDTMLSVSDGLDNES